MTKFKLLSIAAIAAFAFSMASIVSAPSQASEDPPDYPDVRCPTNGELQFLCNPSCIQRRLDKCADTTPPPDKVTVTYRCPCPGGGSNCPVATCTDDISCPQQGAEAQNGGCDGATNTASPSSTKSVDRVLGTRGLIAK